MHLLTDKTGLKYRLTLVESAIFHTCFCVCGGGGFSTDLHHTWIEKAAHFIIYHSLLPGQTGKPKLFKHYRVLSFEKKFLLYRSRYKIQAVL